MSDVLIGTTAKAKCGVKEFRIWLDFSNSDKALARTLWETIRNELGIEIEAVPHAEGIWDLLDMMAKLGYVEYFEY